MAQLKLEERLAVLEKEVAELKYELANGWRAKDWRRTVGMFTGDQMMKEIDEEARKIREADRRKARASQSQLKRAKK